MELTFLYTKNWNNVDNLTGNTPNPLLTGAYEAELRAVVGKTVASIYAPVPQKTPDGQYCGECQNRFAGREYLNAG